MEHTSGYPDLVNPGPDNSELISRCFRPPKLGSVTFPIGAQSKFP